jgi:hypothetical protein
MRGVIFDDRKKQVISCRSQRYISSACGLARSSRWWRGSAGVYDARPQDEEAVPGLKVVMQIMNEDSKEETQTEDTLIQKLGTVIPVGFVASQIATQKMIELASIY